MNTDGDEKRLCRKCGKRLPSNNNFCMFCGCNNNITDEELENLKKIDTSSQSILSNKPIEINVNEKTKETVQNNTKIIIKNNKPLLYNLLFVFILIDIIVMSSLILLKGDSLFDTEPAFNLDNYDEVMLINNDNYIGLKGSKLTIIGESELEEEEITKLEKANIVDIAKTSNNIILVETTDTLYTFNYLDNKLTDNKRAKLTKNAFKDYNNLLNSCSIDNDYYDLLSIENNYIKNGDLYEYNHDYEYESTDNNCIYNYSSKKVLDKKTINMNNPEVVYTRFNSVLLKDKKIIKLFYNGTLIQSVTKIKYNNKVYNLSDFKYILNKDNTFIFITNNNTRIKYYYDLSITSDAISFGIDSSYYKSLHKNELNKTVKGEKVQSETTASNNNSYKELIDQTDIKILLILLAAALLLIGVMYYCKDASFIKTTLFAGGVLFIYYLMLNIYSAYRVYSFLSKFQDSDSFKVYWEAIKTSFLSIPTILIYSMLIAQLKELTTYISNKFNIETIYHFFLIFITIILTMLAAVNYNNDTLLFPLIGILWVFITLNDEDYVEENVNLIIFFKALGLLIASIILGLIICTILKLSYFYTFIIISAFAYAYSIVLCNDKNIGKWITKSIKSSIVIIGYVLIMVISLFISLFNKSMKDGFNDSLGSLFKLFVILIVGIIITYSIIGIALFLVKKTKEYLDKIVKNRILQVFIYMIIMVIVVALILILLQFIAKFATEHLIDDSDLISIFSFLVGLI